MDTSRHHTERVISLAVSSQRQRQLRRVGIRVVNYEHRSSLCKVNFWNGYQQEPLVGHSVDVGRRVGGIFASRKFQSKAVW
jgi:hypothetical protein